MSKDQEYVHRKKYDELKDKNRDLHKKCEELKEKRDELLEQMEDLEDRMSSLLERDSVEDNHKNIEEFEIEISALKKELSDSKKEKKMISEKYRDKINLLERDIILKDGQIQRLEDTKKDLQERFSEMKDDHKELSRYIRSVTMSNIPKKDGL